MIKSFAALKKTSPEEIKLKATRRELQRTLNTPHKKPESIIKVLFFLRTINLKNIALINAGNAIFNVLTPSTVIPPY